MVSGTRGHAKKPATRDGRTSDTRQRIVETALGLFATNGYSHTSLQSIADALGVTKAAVYHHFPSKQLLAGAVFGPFVNDMDNLMLDLDRRRPSQRELLRLWVEVQTPHRLAFTALFRDPSVSSVLRLDIVSFRWLAKLTALLIGEDASLENRARASVAISGLARTVMQEEFWSSDTTEAAIEAAMAALSTAATPRDAEQPA